MMTSDSRTIATVCALRRDILRKVRQVGIASTLWHATLKAIRKLRKVGRRRTIDLDRFDSTYGTDTGRVVSVGAMDIPNEKLEQTNGYQPIALDRFLGIMAEMSIAHEEFVFIDLGSGKGRALLLASHFPFKKIIGVELSARLHEIALSNLRIYKSDLQTCRTIECVCDDASNFELPLQKLVLFLYNPFRDKIMRSVVSHVTHSINRFPRTIYIAYLSPLHQDLWDHSGSFRVMKKTSTYVIYQSKCA